MYKHLCSRVLLNQWSVGSGKRRRIGVLDLDTLECGSKQTIRTGGVPDQIAEPDRFERVWSDEVEKRLPHAVSAVSDPSVLSDRDIVATLKNCIALHYARGFTARRIVELMTPIYADQVASDVLAQVDGGALVKVLTGLHVDSADADQHARDAIRRRFAEELDEKQFFDDVCLTNYRRAQQQAATYELEVWWSAEPHFVLADVPVATDSGSEEVVGVLNGVSWGGARHVWMPVSPHCVVALSKTASWNEAKPAVVVTMNRRQVRSAMDLVYFHLDHGPGEEIARAMRETVSA